MATVTEIIPGINRQPAGPGLQRLVIDSVDLDLLNEQRQTLIDAMDNKNPTNGWLALSAAQVDTLASILNMLDSWSTERAWLREVTR